MDIMLGTIRLQGLVVSSAKYTYLSLQRLFILEVRKNFGDQFGRLSESLTSTLTFVAANCPHLNEKTPANIPQRNNMIRFYT
jgi:hypothetical protein